MRLQKLHTLLSSKLCYNLLTRAISISEIYQQFPNKIMKNQGEGKNRNNINIYLMRLLRLPPLKNNNFSKCAI